MRKAIFFILFFFLFYHAKFTKSYLTVSVEIFDDGSAKVREEIRFRVEGTQDIDLYEMYLKSINDLSGWRSRLNIDELRYHLDPSKVQIYDTKVYPYKLDTCDIYKTSCYGLLAFEYKIKEPIEDKGIVKVEKYQRPRVITYKIDSKVFSFETTPVGSYLPDYTTLEIKIPESKILVLQPLPVEYETKPNFAGKFTYQGRMKIEDLQIIYEKKESLVDEISHFSFDLANSFSKWVTSKEGIMISIVAIILIISYFLLKK
ncbi:MAG: hypothetical protein QXS37_02270 [Candidatus Aenigmatarchaeota archaeon]